MQSRLRVRPNVLSGQQLADLSMNLSTGSVDHVLLEACLHGGLSRVEAELRVAMMLHKVDIANRHRKSLQRYQRRINASSLTWETISYCGMSITVPRDDQMLSLTKQDSKDIINSKPRIIDFLCHVRQYMQMWRFDDDWVETDWRECYGSIAQCKWLEIHFTDTIQTIHQCVEAQPGNRSIIALTGETYEQPETQFSVYGYRTHPSAMREGSNDDWWVFNNSRPCR